MGTSLAKPRFLTGEVVDHEAEMQPLRDRIEQLEADLRKMRQERDTAKADGLAAQSAEY
jgi:cell division protein FtsB